MLNCIAVSVRQFLVGNIDGEGRGDSRADTSRFYLQLSSQLSHSLPHTLYTHAAARNRHRHAFASIENFEFDISSIARDGDAGEPAARMTMDVREALLHDAKNRGLELRRKPAYIRIQM